MKNVYFIQEKDIDGDLGWVACPEFGCWLDAGKAQNKVNALNSKRHPSVRYRISFMVLVDYEEQSVSS